MGLEFSREDYEQIGITNLSDCIYNVLKKKILTLSILPGMVINIKDIEDALGVSRTPVRDAISRLGKDALIDIVPQKETKASLIDLSRVSQERFFRWAVERKVVEEACSKCSDRNYVKLNEYVERQEEEIRVGDHKAEIIIDNEFHSYVFEIAEKKDCWDTIANNSYNYERIRQLAMNCGNISEKSCEQHRNIARYIYLNKPKEAVAELDRHLNDAKYENQAIINEYPEYFVKQ